MTKEFAQFSCGEWQVKCNDDTKCFAIPPHKQQCYADWNAWSFPVSEKIHREELSLPMSPALTMDEVKTVVDLLNQWK